MAGDRVPLAVIGGSLAPYVGVDMPIGAVGGNLATLFVVLSGTDAINPTSFELRDDTMALATLTIPAGDRSGQLDVTPLVDVADATDLYLRVTAATFALGLSGWYELEPTSFPSDSLTTLDRVKRYLGETGTANDTLLSELMLSASNRIQRYCERGLVAATTASEKHDGTGWADWIYLHSYPIEADSVIVTIDGVVQAATEIEEDDRNAGRILYTPEDGEPQAWPMGRRNLDFSYNHGFVPVPDDLVGAATVQTAWDFKRTGGSAGRLGERSNVIGGNTTTFLVDPWSPDVLEVLQRYKRRDRPAWPSG